MLSRDDLGLPLLLLTLVVFLMPSSAFAYSCLPTCADNDGKFMALQGTELIITSTKIGVISHPGAQTVELGIFDGDNGVGADNFWDSSEITMEYTLFADPNGDGSGAFQVAKWTGDGSGGDNAGNPMPDNDWFVATLNNTNAAKAADGTFKYYLLVEGTSFVGNPTNVFKVRTDGVLYLFPFQNIAFTSSWFGGPGTFVDNPKIIFPDFDPSDPACLDPGTGTIACERGEPGCCINNTTYDGIWDFYMDVPGNVSRLDLYDGDFDYSSAPGGDPNAGGCIQTTIVDTDDPNTPNTLPPFDMGPNTQPEGANGDFLPPDDGCFDPTRRSPPITYDLIGPLGNIYNNQNVSGNQEWELFNLSTAPFDPTVMDVHVESIAAGVWNMHVRGADLGNFMALRFTLPVVGVDEGGNPTLFVPAMPTSIPTMGEWAMIFFAAFAMMAGVYYLHRMRDISHM